MRSWSVVGLLVVVMLFAFVDRTLASGPLPPAVTVAEYAADPGPAPSPGTVDANPTDAGTQSWSGSHGTGVDEGGIPAWETTDNGFSPTWKYTVPGTHVTTASANGWRLSWRVKAVLGTASYPASQAISVILMENDQTDVFRLNVGVLADGDQQIEMWLRNNGVPSSQNYICHGSGEVYHLYEMVFDPVSTSVNLFVDGVLRLSSPCGVLQAGGFGVDVRFGDGSTSSNPERTGRHNLVRWEIVSDADCNGNGQPDSGDVATGFSLDCNANGIPDECERDCNSNGIPDECDLAAGTSLDCNANDRPDECDIAYGLSADVDMNGIPDECLTPGTRFERGDCNADSSRNIADAVRLLTLLFPQAPPPDPVPCEDACDANDDGGLNIADAVAMLTVLFPTGAPTAWPEPVLCGFDPTTDAIDCADYSDATGTPWCP